LARWHTWQSESGKTPLSKKREKLISVQHGQNSVIGQLRDPHVFGAYVRAAGGRNPSIEDRGTAFAWVVQYLNHFQVVHELHRSGAMNEEQYQLWAGYAVSIVAPAGMRRWWDDENGRLAFHSEVREMIDQRLDDPDNPPVPLTELWTFFSPDAWESASRKPWAPALAANAAQHRLAADNKHGRS
jgi:hypothetical protein